MLLVVVNGSASPVLGMDLALGHAAGVNGRASGCEGDPFEGTGSAQVLETGTAGSQLAQLAALAKWLAVLHEFD